MQLIMTNTHNINVTCNVTNCENWIFKKRNNTSTACR